MTSSEKAIIPFVGPFFRFYLSWSGIREALFWLSTLPGWELLLTIKLT